MPLTATCPRCRVLIPLTMDGDHVDGTEALAHARMHAACRCDWGETSVVWFEPDCPIHGDR